MRNFKNFFTRTGKVINLPLPNNPNAIYVLKGSDLIKETKHRHFQVLKTHQCISATKEVWNENYLTSFEDDGVRALWKQAHELNIVIELHIGPDYAKQAGDAIRAFPGCTVLIDHLAEPHLGTGVEFANVLDLASLPNVYMKLSGLNHFAKDEPYYVSAKPFTARVIDAFGPDRLVWGSGIPGIVDVHMKGYSSEDIAKVKGGNIRRILNW